MFDNIYDLLSVVLVATVFVVALIGVIQYSRYEAHRKAHINDPEFSDSYKLATSFAAVPYLIVPLAFGIVGVFSSLILTDIIAGMGFLPGIAAGYFCVAVSIVLYMLMDKLIVRHCGDALYFDTIEDKLFPGIKSAETKSGTVTIPVEQYDDLVLRRK